MATTLKGFFEAFRSKKDDARAEAEYRPKSGDEQKFADKHTVQKHKDRNGNGDDVFSGAKIKAIDRKGTRHGYASGEDIAVYESTDLTEDLLQALDEGALEFKGFTLTSHPKLPDANEGPVSHIEGSAPRLKKLAVPTERGKSYSKTRHIRVKNNSNGNVTSHHVYQSDFGNNHIKPTISVRNIGVTTSNHKAHEAVLKHYLSGKTKINAMVESTDLTEDKMRTPNKHNLADHIIGADAIKKTKEGHFRVAHSFFYKHGRTSAGHAKSVSDDLTKSGIGHTVVDHGEQDYKPFRGGASVWTQNHHWVDLHIHPGQKIATESYETPMSLGRIFEELIEVGNPNKETFTEASLAILDVFKQAERMEQEGLNEDNSAQAKLDELVEKCEIALNEHSKESLEELSKQTLGSYVRKASNSMAQSHAEVERARADRNAAHAIDHATSGTPSSVRNQVKDIIANDSSKREKTHFKKVINRHQGLDKAVNKLTKEDIINRTIDRYMPEEATQIEPDEYIVEMMEDYSEVHIHSILELYDSLTESNQLTLLETIKTPEGINGLLNFVIEARGV